jgi:signal transduction histidine kinase
MESLRELRSYTRSTDPHPTYLSLLKRVFGKFSLRVRYQRYVFLLLTFWAVSVLFLVFPAIIFVEDFSNKLVSERNYRLRDSTKLVAEFFRIHTYEAKKDTTTTEETKAHILSHLPILRHSLGFPMWIIDSNEVIVFHSDDTLISKSLKSIPHVIYPTYQEILDSSTSEGGSYINYLSSNIGLDQEETPLVTKMAYVVPIKDLNWVIGLSYTVDDVTKIRHINRLLLGLLFFIYALLSIAYTNYLIVYTRKRTVDKLLSS